MTDFQQGDVLFIQDFDFNFTVESVNGVMTMSPGFETALYLSLFGGNVEDDGLPGNAESWWGNLLETDPRFMYRSRTQHILQSLPATSANLLLLEQAVKQDLEWFVSSEIADEIRVNASIPAFNRVDILITVTAEGEESSFTFTENWKASL